MAKTANHCMDRLTSILTSAAISSADGVLTTARQDEGTLLSLDECAKVDLALLTMQSGAPAEAGCPRRILGCLSSTEDTTEPEESMQLLDQLNNKASFKLAPKSSQALAKWALDITMKLVEGALSYSIP